MLCQISVAQEITVAAAPDLQFAMQDVVTRFQKKDRNIKVMK